MPEYHNIQAYLSLRERTFEDAIDTCARMFAAIAPRTAACDAWLGALPPALRREDYPPVGPPLAIALGDETVAVLPRVALWTPEVIPALACRWIEVGLLLESEALETGGLDEPRYRPEVERPLGDLVAAFLPVARDAPAFLTTEAGDGAPWEAFVGEGDRPWAFDLAITAGALPWPGAPLPAGYARGPLPGGGAMIARRAAWHRPPTDQR